MFELEQGMQLDSGRCCHHRHASNAKGSEPPCQHAARCAATSTSTPFSWRADGPHKRACFEVSRLSYPALPCQVSLSVENLHYGSSTSRHSLTEHHRSYTAEVKKCDECVARVSAVCFSVNTTIQGDSARTLTLRTYDLFACYSHLQLTAPALRAV